MNSPVYSIHLVGACDHGCQNLEAESLRSLEIDHQLILDGRLYWKIGWFLALEDAVDIMGRLSVLVDQISPTGAGGRRAFRP
jgi:hypothetical protein